jgi:hypothetical protein
VFVLVGVGVCVDVDVTVGVLVLVEVTVGVGVGSTQHPPSDAELTKEPGLIFESIKILRKDHIQI